MKVYITKSGREAEVYAIMWQQESRAKWYRKSKSTTLISCYNGTALQDYEICEIEFTDESLDAFVFKPSFDDEYHFLIWEPLLDAGIWSSLRNYEPDALKEFQELRSKFSVKLAK